MPRRKKYNSADSAQMDPMTAAIMTGLKPHIDAAVREQVATVLLDVLTRIAPERLAKARVNRAESGSAAPEVAATKPDSAPAKAVGHGK